MKERKRTADRSEATAVPFCFFKMGDLRVSAVNNSS